MNLTPTEEKELLQMVREIYRFFNIGGDNIISMEQTKEQIRKRCLEMEV